MEPKLPGALCEECPLREEPCVPPYIAPNAKVVIIGEAPGREEAIEGQPFVGPSGRLLHAIAEQIGVDYEGIASRTNCVACRPPGNREPSGDEISCCSERLAQELATGPTRLITVGKTSKIALLGFDAPRGVWVDWNGFKVMPTWHPAYVLRKPSAFGNLERDLREAFADVSGEVAPPEVRLVASVDELARELTECMGEWVAFDIETEQIQWYDTPDADADKILMLQLAWGPKYAVVIPREVLLEPTCATTLNGFFSIHKLTAHNAMFDSTFLRTQFGIQAKCDFDTMLAHYVLDENSRHGLKELALEYFGIPDYEDSIKQYLRSRNDNYAKIPRDVLAQYAAWDAVVTWRFREHFDKILRAEGMYEQPFMSLIMPAHHALVKVRETGVQVDIPHLAKWSNIMDQEMTAKLRHMQEMCDNEDFNPNSPVQVARVVWDQRGLQVNTQTKVYRERPRSTCEEALEHLHSFDPNTGRKIRDGDEFVDELLEYRHIAKMKSSYVDNLMEVADVRGRVHPDILIHGTEIGRLSFRSPALQTIPRASERLGAAIRSAIVAAPGRTLVIADYSQAELRVLAALSGDPFLLQVYAEDRDLHSEVARAMFGPEYTKEQRVMCKMFNFAYAYGGTEYSFARDAGLDLSKARDFVRVYDQNMARAREWKLEMVRQARNQGYVSTRFGRRRHFPLITDANAEDVRKSAVHMPIASTASDLTLTSAIRMISAGWDVVLLVHDSIIIECDSDKADLCSALLQHTMTEVGNEYVPEVPWKVDVEVSKRWCEPPES